MTIGIGGWGARRKPMALVREILRSPLKDLTVVSYGGPDVGLLTVTVYRERGSGTTPEPLEDADAVAVTRGVLPARPPANVGALRAQLNESLVTRGIVEVDEKKELPSKVKFVEGLWDKANPVMSAVARYYKPQGGKN